MKKVLMILSLFGALTTITAAPLLVEAYQKGTITIPAGETDTVTIVKISFSVDTACYVQFSAGGFTAHAFTWFALDGVDLPPQTRMGHNTVPQGFSLPYAYILNAGSHTLELTMTIWGSYAAICEKAYLQALIFMPDSGGAINEQPTADANVSNASVLSTGPYVRVPGCIKVRDVSGRNVDCQIDGDKVMLSTLSAGTYFAETKTGTGVKIVKVN